ncbi:hypothetical protein HN588_05285 [Candidatus Bathyarchaeota archaeon]|jgi:cytoskeleton protein RodZ|nr:hypothetical protein [Candidatus Bathyarchaeota archaeon]
MKTAGELLKDKRQLKELSIDDIARKIKVKPEYLTALENSVFTALPSPTTTKGYLRNYARSLHLNPDTIIAMFRRDYKEGGVDEIIPPGLVDPVAGKPKLINANLILGISSLIFFLIFLGYQVFSWLSLPKLEVIQPIDSEVYGEKVTVKGATDLGATVTVDGQQVLIDQNGQFTLDLLFPAGTHSVIIKAENREGKSRLLERTFQISK